MATVINININGVSQSSQPTPEPFRGYTLLPGFTATRELLGERKLKAKKKKKCTNGQVCGFSCISKTKTCKANMTTAQLKEHNAAKRAEKKAKKAAAKGGGAASAIENATTDHQKNLLNIANGGEDLRDAETIKRQDQELMDYNNSQSFQSHKIKKLMDDGLTEEEAHGLAAWVDHNYEPINKVIYAPDEISPSDKDYAEGAGVRATQGLQKLPSYNYSQMKELAGKGNLLEEGKLLRGVSDIGDIDAFLRPYEEAVGKSEYREPTLFATSAKQNLGFIAHAQVLYEIRSKSDGSGQGKSVDAYKNSAIEAEVLFPPYSRFRVLQVERESVPAAKKTPQPKALDIFDGVSPSQIKNLPSEIQSKITEGGSLSVKDMAKISDLVKDSELYYATKDAGGKGANSVASKIKEKNGGVILPRKAISTIQSNLYLQSTIGDNDSEPAKILQARIILEEI